MSNATATLCAHSGAEKIERTALVHVPTPAATLTHRPVPHHLLVDEIDHAVSARGYRIVKEEYAVQTGGQKLFGTMVLSQYSELVKEEVRFALGFRTANDKSIAHQMVSGMNVFVCDNMAMSGSIITLHRKHTSRVDIRWEVNQGVGRAIEQYSKLFDTVERYKRLEIADVVAKAKITEAAYRGAIPLRLLPKVYDLWTTPPHPEFEPRTVWSLHNAFSEALKELAPNVAMRSNIELGAMFKM